MADNWRELDSAAPLGGTWRWEFVLSLNHVWGRASALQNRYARAGLKAVSEAIARQQGSRAETLYHPRHKCRRPENGKAHNLFRR
jgi:hypothetical protein